MLELASLVITPEVRTRRQTVPIAQGLTWGHAQRLIPPPECIDGACVVHNGLSRRHTIKVVERLSERDLCWRIDSR